MKFFKIQIYDTETKEQLYSYSGQNGFKTMIKLMKILEKWYDNGVPFIQIPIK